MDSAFIIRVYSIGYCYRYVRTVLEGPLLDSTSRWYELLIFAIFVSYLSCMLLHLNEKMKRSLLFVILGYFTFFTIEIFGNITTKIACYPFWISGDIYWQGGYCYISHGQGQRKQQESFAGFFPLLFRGWSISVIRMLHRWKIFILYLNASQYWEFCILYRKRRPEGEITILPVLAGIVALVEVFVW